MSQSSKPPIGPFTALFNPETLVDCVEGEEHEIVPYRIWWCLGLAWGARCNKCSYKNSMAFD